MLLVRVLPPTRISSRRGNPVLSTSRRPTQSDRTPLTRTGSAEQSSQSEAERVSQSAKEITDSSKAVLLHFCCSAAALHLTGEE